MSNSRQNKTRNIHTGITRIIILWLSLCLFIMAEVIQHDIQQAKLIFNRQVESYSDQLDRYLISSNAVLKGFSAIFSTIRKHQYKEIKQYVNDVIEDNPQIFALEVVQKVTREQVPFFVATMRREVSPASTLKLKGVSSNS